MQKSLGWPDKRNRRGVSHGRICLQQTKKAMSSPRLHRQLFEQLSQWIVPKDRRHLQVFSEIVAAMLMAQSACQSHWIPYFTHRKCQARSHLERLRYFLNNPKYQISALLAKSTRDLIAANCWLIVAEASPASTCFCRHSKTN
jgi:hypothetical protein